MLSLTQNVIILFVVMLASLLLLLGLNRMWPVATRYSEGDLIGWQLSVLGTTYAVVLGFMLYTLWTNFGAAELNVNLEANALRNNVSSRRRIASTAATAARNTGTRLCRCSSQSGLARDGPRADT